MERYLLYRQPDVGGSLRTIMADEVLDAELVPSKVVLTELEHDEDSQMRADRRELNQVLGATVAIVIVALLLSRIITAPLRRT